MSVMIVSGKVPILYQKSISSWRKNHPDRTLYSSFEDVKVPESGLFDEGPLPGLEIHVTDAAAASVRTLAAESADKADILVVSQNKPRAKFDKDGFDVVDRTLPSGEKALSAFLSKEMGIDRKTSSQCAREASKPESAVLMAMQSAMCDGSVSKGSLYDPFRGDVPPWDITDSISSGNSPGAVAAVQAALNQGMDPTSLMFQIVGLFSKVVMVGDDSGDMIDPSKRRFYRGKERSLTDPKGLNLDITEYSSRILSAGKWKGYVLCAMVSSMASRFM